MILVPIDVPARVIGEPDNLPADWNGLPYSASAREVRDLWVGSRASAALLVPSVVLPAERNLLINPAAAGLPPGTRPSGRTVRVRSAVAEVDAERDYCAPVAASREQRPTGGRAARPMQNSGACWPAFLKGPPRIDA